MRATRFLYREALRDGRNSIGVNGEALLQKAVLELGSDPCVVLDVGGHYGEWSLSLLGEANDKVVQLHVFEPSRFTFAKLHRKMQHLPHVTLNKLAVSDAPGEAVLNVVHEGAGSNSLIPFDSRGGLEAKATESVAVTSIDTYCADLGLEQITMLKVDAEGNDLRVLRGATTLLRRGAIDFVQFEYNHRWIDARAFLADVFAFLQPLGYRVGKITPQGVEFYPHWTPELETFVEGNFFACRGEQARSIPSLPWWNV